jgi:membrane protein required for colicin V production
VQGFRKGFISQAVSLVSLVLGAWLAFKFSEPVGEWLKSFADVNGVILQVLSFSFIFLVVYLILLLLGKLAQNLVKVVMLGWLDKLLGLVFALIKTAIIVGVLIVLFHALNLKVHLVKPAVLDGSFLYTGLKDLTCQVFPFFKKLLLP